MVSSTQDAQRTSRKDVALSFCVLEPVSIEKNAVFIGWQGMTKTFVNIAFPAFVLHCIAQVAIIVPTRLRLCWQLHCLLICLHPLSLCH